MKHVLTDTMSDDNNIEELQSKCNHSMNLKKHNLKSTKIQNSRGNYKCLIYINII